MAEDTPPPESGSATRDAQTGDSNVQNLLAMLARKREAAKRLITRKTRTPAISTPAADQVFAVTEILEKILFYLPARDLLIDQRVCHKWRAVTKENRVLQQALWMQPRDYKENFYLTEPNDLSLQRGPINPFGFEIFRPLQDCYPDFDHHIYRDEPYDLVPPLCWTKDKKKRKAMLRKEASWRKMLVSETYFSIVCVPESMDEFQTRTTTLDGPRLGALYDLHYAFKSSHYRDNGDMAWFFTEQFNPPTEQLRVSNMSHAHLLPYLMLLQCYIVARRPVAYAPAPSRRGLSKLIHRYKTYFSVRMRESSIKELESEAYGVVAQEAIDWVVSGNCGIMVFWWPSCDEEGRYAAQTGGEKIWEDCSELPIVLNRLRNRM
ncbi:hypothetical protein K490DRAFT_61613 [Saccharata proteae CBS 121410]|uniref:F-box domain-containing protein n=1 Tax=Saccharata proteae CBS 121410 TaxID=1314787 RepID=A0A9P4M3S9_9PEZI|nr:hypothetical protein K490DRAFT_61613 [Saccharata proteae CBS 121410]